MSSNLLYIVFHFPPVSESSGALRTLSFINALKKGGWNVNVLTVKPKAYPNFDESNCALIPDNVEVIRSECIDIGKVGWTKGKYPGVLALPDRWASWLFDGVVKGWRKIKASRPDFIVSTYPIATAHMLGYLLSRFTGVKWVTDFRDPMSQFDYPANRLQRKFYWWIEKKAARHSSVIFFATEESRQHHVKLYGSQYKRVKQTLVVLENGYDESLFALAQQQPRHSLKEQPFTLLYPGAISIDERNPSAFLIALAQLKNQSLIPKSGVSVVFRCAGDLTWLSELAVQYGVDDLVITKGVVDHVNIAAELLEADALLLFQGDNCDMQIPAKAYEYIRANRPVLTMAGAKGATFALMDKVGLGPTVALQDVEKIRDGLVWLFEHANQWQSPLNEVEKTAYSRQEQSQTFVHALNAENAVDDIAK